MIKAIRFTFLYFVLTGSLTVSLTQTVKENFSEGFLINPVTTSYGIVAVDEFESVVYLINDDQIQKIVEGPGCGRFLNFSMDRSKFGFKLIDPKSGLETPAIYNFADKKIISLYQPSKRAGQVSFSDNGKIAFMIGTSLVISSGETIVKYNVGVFSNNASISPDGKQVVFRDEFDQLWIFDLEKLTKQKITDDTRGYYNARWSPDTGYISFESVDGNIFIYNRSEGIKHISKGENPKWSADSKKIIFHQKEIDFANVQLINSDLFIYDILSDEIIRITSTQDVFEMDASFTDDAAIIYHTQKAREILKLKVKKNSGATNLPETLYKLDQPLLINTFESLNKGIINQNQIADASGWIHIHQVFDTHDAGSWTSDPVNNRHQGYLCCGATSAMEAIASYGILPPDPISTYGHTSEYGKYISDLYTYNGYTYSNFSIRSGSPGFYSGAHGFMWNGGGSPHSNTVSFLQRHGIEASLSDNMSWGKIKSELELGFPYILCSTSLTDGHIVLAIQQYQDRKALVCNDPYGDKNAGSYGAIRNGKNAVYDWSDENTGHQKITPVVWGVTARYSRTLQLLSTYPQKNQMNISPSTHIFLNFYGNVDPVTVQENVKLISEDGVAIDFSVVDDKCSEGVVEIVPSQELSENTFYSIEILHQIASTSGLQLKRNDEVKFCTGYHGSYSGSILEGFDEESNWSLITSGTNAGQTNTTFTSGIKKNGANALQLNYDFTLTSSGYCRVLFSPEIVIEDTEFESIGMWIFGNCSNNVFEFWFTHEDGYLVKGLAEIINWSGWKFIEFPFDQLNFQGSKLFNCFAVRQSSTSQRNGTLYFDELMSLKGKLSVINSSPGNFEEGVELNSSIVFAMNREIDLSTLGEGFSISPGTEGSFNWDNENNQLTFIPVQELISNIVYTIKLDSTVKDIYGNKLAQPFVLMFSTERTKVSLLSTYPANNDYNVSTMFDVILQFDYAINPASLAGNILFLDSNGEAVPIYVDQSFYSKGIVKFQPQNDLAENDTYKIQIKPGVKDNEGLSFDEEFEINFSVRGDDYLGGNIIHDFENDLGWKAPKDNELSVGVDYLETKFYRDNKRKVSGEYSGVLQYKFKGIKGICRLEILNDIVLDNHQNFGMWMYGDFSHNIVEYWFKDNQNSVYKMIADTLNYTGWKMVDIDLTGITFSGELKFNSIVLLQMNGETSSSKIYIDDIQIGIILSGTDNVEFPVNFSLEQNYPNPFNPSTTIRFSIPQKSKVELKVFDILGRELLKLVDEIKAAGNYTVEFNAGSLTSGVYFYRLKTDTFVSIRKMLLLK